MSQTAPPPPVALRCALDYPDADAFIASYGRNVSAQGIFLPSREPVAVGTTVRFELELHNGRLLLRGEGGVVFHLPFNPAQPAQLHGLALRWLRLDADSQLLVERLLAYKAAHPADFLVEAADPVTTPPPAPIAAASATSPPPAAALAVTVTAPLPLLLPLPPRREDRGGAEAEELAELGRPPAALPLPPPREAARRLEAILSRRR
jgi:hypothetical protein